MKRFEIVTDSICNLSVETLKKHDIVYLPIHFFIGDKSYDATRDWRDFSAKDFYDMVRQGIRITSSNINASEYEKVFSAAIEEGKDVLSISCTAALSACVNESRKAKEALEAKYPDAKIICIDSNSACFALGMLVVEAAKLREQGKSIEEVAEWVEEHKRNFSQVGTVDKLTYLKQAGRISATAAFFGGILGVKPIIVADELGHNVAIEKVKGKKNSYERCADYIEKYAVPEVYNKICIAHGDCIENAEELAETIKKRFPENTFEFEFDYIESGMGASCGPGTIIVDYYGKEGNRAKSGK